MALSKFIEKRVYKEICSRHNIYISLQHCYFIFVLQLKIKHTLSLTLSKPFKKSFVSMQKNTSKCVNTTALNLIHSADSYASEDQCNNFKTKSFIIIIRHKKAGKSTDGELRVQGFN